MKDETLADRRNHLEFLRDETVFVSILENLNSGVALIDGSGHFVTYNRKFLKLFGLSEESTIRNVNDQNWADWQVFGEDLKVLHVEEHPVRKAALTGKMVSNQLVGVRLPSGGDIIWMLISAEPLFNEEGKIEKTICTYLDITEHKLADAALRRSEQRYRQLFNSMSEILQIVEPILDDSGNAVDYIFHDVNPVFEEVTGKAKEQVLNKRVSEVIGKISPEWFKAFNEVFRTGTPVRFESYGNIFNKHYELFVWKTIEDTIAVIMTDITQRKIDEKVLVENENRLKELNATKDKLFSIISHDLKTPFSGIIGFSELLIEKLEKGDNGSASDYARIILDSSWQAISLVTNLVEWSRLQTGRITFNPAPLDVVSVINEVTGLLYATAKQKSIDISVQISESPDELTIPADKAMIATVLRNLLSNAIKFSHPGGEVKIAACRKGEVVAIEVIDKGIGMDNETVEKLFKSDHYLSTRGTKNESGTGLGIVISKEFIAKHGGEICVDSRMGKGSTFVFTLPATKLTSTGSVS